MEKYKEMMHKDLIDIEEFLIENKNPDMFSDLILDRQLLLFELYNKKIEQMYQNTHELLKNNDIECSIISNQIKRLRLKPFPTNRKKYIDNLKIFEKFLKEDFFDLRESYNKILTDKTLFYTKEIPKLSGCTIYLNSLKKNYVLINESHSPYDNAILVHELGHAKQNLLPRTFVSLKLDSNFGETYSYFLMLVYFDYIKNFGYEKEAFNYKYKFLKIMLSHLKGLHIVFDSEERYTRGFQYQYKLVISKLLAIYFYNLYLTNPNECLSLIDIFNENYENVSDYDLLKSIGLDFSVFKNRKTLDTFIERLQEEKVKIKQK